jgi:hypothetical protein
MRSPDGGATEEPPVDGIDWFADDTGEYFWNAAKGKYEHYAYSADGSSTSFSGYFNASDSSKPVGDFSFSGDRMIKLDEIVMNVDIRSFGEKAGDFTRDVINPYVRTYTKVNTIITRQLNVIIEEGVHPGRAYSYESYKGWNFYQELDDN